MIPRLLLPPMAVLALILAPAPPDALAGIPGDWQAAARKVGLDPASPPNLLAVSEQALGWRLLFDGKTLDGWTGFRKPLGTGWAVESGTLARKGASGDIMTREQFGDFVWSAEWKVAPQVNSGMFSRVLEQGDESWWTGIEMQVLHNEPGTLAKHAAGSKFDMYPPTETGSANAPFRDATVTDSTGYPAGFNRAMVIAQGKKFDFWLNGVRVVTFEVGSADWNARAEGSTYYKAHPEHGQAPKGHLLLQEHGGAVWYRNIKVRPLAAGQSPYVTVPSFILTPIGKRGETSIGWVFGPAVPGRKDILQWDVRGRFFHWTARPPASRLLRIGPN